nr:YgcG family protein [Variovorax sp. WDL1]
MGKALLLAFALCWSSFAAAQVPVPPLTGHVTDQTGTLTAEQTASLEQTLTAFEARKGSQLAVLMVATSAPEEIEQFALRVAEQWKLGRKKVDDGAILVVAKDDRALRIEVGYGLEGALTDLTSKRIISETILPRFKSQDFHGGIKAGVGQIIRVIDGEPLPEAGNKSTGSIGDVQQYLPVLFIVALALGGLLRAKLGKVPGSLVTGGVVAVIAWFVVGALSMALVAGVIALFVTLVGGGMVGHGFGGYYGGGGRGGRGGGGFSGGGGGFGGGGATGRW